MTPTQSKPTINILPQSRSVSLDSLHIGQPFRFPKGERVYIVIGRSYSYEGQTEFLMLGSERSDFYRDRGDKEVNPLEFEAITLREV